VNLPLKKNCK